MKIGETILLFEDYLRNERRLSGLTVETYLSDLNFFKSYLDREGIDDTGELSPLLLRDWEVELLESGLKSRSVTRKMASLRAWNKFLRKQKIYEKDLFTKITSLKTPKRLPVFFRESEMETALETENIFADDFEGVRNKLIIELLYVTGMRRAELISLKDSSVDLQNGFVKVFGKRSKERIVPIESDTRQMIENYILLRNEKVDNKTDRLFVTLKGNAVYPMLVERVVKTYMSLVSNADKVSPHVLRHTFATHLLNNGADINAIKELLGHANLAATQVYTHNTIERLKETYKTAHPRAKK